MKEIKFRAWMPVEKQMVYEISIDKPIDNLDEFFKLTAKDGLVWMQFTGLKDENGKEIYEGDIVKNGMWLEWVPTFDKFIEMARCDDEFIDYSFCEVVGNIHENPELAELM